MAGEAVRWGPRLTTRGLQRVLLRSRLRLEVFENAVEVGGELVKNRQRILGFSTPAYVTVVRDAMPPLDMVREAATRPERLLPVGTIARELLVPVE